MNNPALSYNLGSCFVICSPGKERCVITTAYETKSPERWREIVGSIPKSEITAFALRGSVDHVEMAVSFSRRKR